MIPDKLRITAYKAEVKKLIKRIAQLESENALQKRALREMGVKSLTLTRMPARFGAIDATGTNGCKISLQS